MRIIAKMLSLAVGISLLASPIIAEETPNPRVAAVSKETSASPPAPQTSFEVSDRYTAQRRPRVTVLDFDDTNQEALSAKYGSSVEAMLVTFLKRKSQFVVVERQKLGNVMLEKERIQRGRVQIQADDPESRALLEKIDVFVLGSVTLLNIPTEQTTAPKAAEKLAEAIVSDEEEEFELDPATYVDGGDSESSRARAEKREAIRGPRIEIDALLISRFDGRIIAAAQRSGPVACLRSIVERLGIALEQEFLRPYYGKLTVTLNEPENVRVYLTPILYQDALDEEKPPVERSSTVTIAGDYDIINPWTTDPTTYTIESLLSGWYSMRLERPGYQGLGIENSRWEVRKQLGQEIVYDRQNDQPLEKVKLEDRRFVVRVDPLRTDVIDGNALRFAFIKEGGSIAPMVKRQYLDGDFAQAPQRVILMGGSHIRLNQIERPDEYADDEKCDLFDERRPLLSNYGRAYVAAGQSFDFDSFTGGELIIEDYKGEVVPVGRYKMKLWEPSYLIEEAPVTVRAGDQNKQVKASLTRETSDLDMEATGPRPPSRALLEGRDTRHRIEVPLDFSDPKELPGIPVDEYSTTTDINGLTGWRRSVEVPASNVAPPVYDTTSEKNKPELIEAPKRAAQPAAYVSVKTRFGLAGRLGILSQRPDPLASDLFIDQDLEKILNLLLYGVPVRPGDEDRRDFLDAAAEVGRQLAPVAASVLGGPAAALLVAGRSPEPSPSQAPAENPAPPPPDPFPKDPGFLRRLLAQKLEVIDLLVLDPVDMVQLRRSPEVAGIIARYVASGGALFAFVSAPGDYREIVGTPLSIEEVSKATRRFELAPGDLSVPVQTSAKKKLKVKAKRQLPQRVDLTDSWRVIAYTKGGKGPRIIERGTRGQGGYVALWLDDPEAFRGRWGGTRAEVEQARSNVEEHVLKTARELMRSRFDPSIAQQPGCTDPALIR